jgi:hypothetical protein
MGGNLTRRGLFALVGAIAANPKGLRLVPRTITLRPGESVRTPWINLNSYLKRIIREEYK